MLKFEQGNPENLEGRVFIHANVKTTTTNGHTHIYYGTSERDEMLRKIGDLDKLPGVEETLGRIVDEIMKGMSKIGAVPVYFIGYELMPGEIFERPKDHDIIFVGNFQNSESCDMAMRGASYLYAGNFAEQFFRRGTSRSDFHKVSQPESRLTPNIKYTEFGGETLPDYMLKTYVVPMLDAVRYGQPNIYDTLRKEFTEFSRGAPFMGDVQQISILAKDGLGKA
jgi:hypothetical protein